VLRAVLLACLIGTLFGGCGGESATPEPPPSQLTGLITEVEPERGTPEKFLLEADGQGYEVQIDPARDYGFDLVHLREHQRDAWPVRCRLEERDGVLYALEIVDA
jgi:hypothetical protein